MIALFNKSGSDNVDEVRIHCSFIDADLAYSKIAGEIEFESEEIRVLIGDATYQRALTHYLSANYAQPAEQDPVMIVLNRLVFLIQAPVANFAYLAFAPHNDINQTGNGRTIHVSENEKPAFEWQINRSETALHRKAHRQVDQLLVYLEEKRDILTEWKNSAERKENFDLFISNALQLDRIYPISRSRWLYIKLSPFLREYQEEFIHSVIGTERYTALQDKLKGTDPLDPADSKLLSMIRRPMGLYAMSLGLLRLSMKFLPDGITQSYMSDRDNIKASQVASAGARTELSQQLKAEAASYLKLLENHITTLDTPEDTSADTSVDDDLIDPCSEPYFSS